MNILLVEDEPPILREIKSIIESFQEDYCVISTALNGQVALDYLSKHHKEVDVMITDLHIPVVDGLDLIQYVTTHMPHILCIILTGYSKFEYAKKAIQYGVFNYLLKPIDEEELKKQLQLAYSQKCVDYLKEDSFLISDSALKPVPTESTPTISSYYLAVVSLGHFPLQFTTLDCFSCNLWEHIDWDSLFKKNSSLVSDYWIINGALPSVKNILFSFQTDIKDGFESRFLQIFDSLMHLPFLVTVAIDNQFSGIHTVRNSVQKLQLFLSKNVRIEESQILFYSQEPERDNVDSFTNFQSFQKRLLQLFQEKNMRLFKAELRTCLNTMKVKKVTQAFVSSFLYQLMNACMTPTHDVSSHQNTNTYATLSDIIILSDNYDTLYDNLLSIFNSFFESSIKELPYTNNRDDALIKIDAYMKENFNKPINIKELSLEFGFTPAYLSKIFRDYKKITPTEYLTYLRIEKAKQLFLADSSCKIKDIATYVGYEDSLYFSKVFKKSTGMSPKQFLSMNHL